MPTFVRAATLTGLAIVLLVGAGCVERNMKIQTDPPGALVSINDEEVGVSPVKFSFLWYGDYDIVLRKAGSQTLTTHYRVDAPWYEWPPIDLIAETLIPTQIRDEHELPTFALAPAETPAVADVVQRAVEAREEALRQPQGQ
jgi:hypothetical protein